MIYIRRVRVSEPGTHSAHITHVQYSFSTTGTLRPTSREQVVRDIDAGRGYRSHNDSTRKQADVVTRTGTGGRRYITTVADGKETNNLLALPRF